MIVDGLERVMVDRMSTTDFTIEYEESNISINDCIVSTSAAPAAGHHNQTA